MKDLAAALTIATAIAAGAGLTIKHLWPTDYYCPPPTAASVETLFAPCQAFDTAMGRKITKKEAVRMGLLKPKEETQSATRLAEGSAAAEWIDPKAARTSMQMSVQWPMRLI